MTDEEFEKRQREALLEAERRSDEYEPRRTWWVMLREKLRRSQEEGKDPRNG